MERKAVSAIMLTLFLTVMLTLSLDVHRVKASGTIYIRANGSVDPPDAPISTFDNITYTFIDNIYDSIVVERDNIVVDGAGYTLQGSGTGIDLSSRSNVTIKNMEIKAFDYGIWLQYSSNITISGNNIATNPYNYAGIWLEDSSNNSISENNLTHNYNAIRLENCSNNGISRNNMTDNYAGILLSHCSNNSIYENNMMNNQRGIKLSYSSNSSISENNITKNYFGVWLYYSSNITIPENNITRNSYEGIRLEYSSNNSVSVNNIAKNYNGIELRYSSNNTLVGNDVTENSYYGTWLVWSSNNSIYHNNFADNAVQVECYYSTSIWDDGYPSGGNYWSDYTDVDLYCGPNQDMQGSDGIWDHPYIIDEENQDNCPLTTPYTPQRIFIYTNNYTFHTGDTMEVGLHIINLEDSLNLCVTVWLERPSDKIYLLLHAHNVALPIGLDYDNPTLKSFTLPSIPLGIYTWHAAFLNPPTHAILVEDTAEWQFV